MFVFATSLNFMAQRNFRVPVGGDEDVPSFPSPLAPDRGATALNLVHQAADVFRSMEKRARETEARAQSLCTSALERLRLAEGRAEAAERAQRELIIATDLNCKMLAERWSKRSPVLRLRRIS
ncbi:hypothetical protein Q3C01_41175 [Bradyrhizobium sp. UFLA05-109]